MNRACLQMLLVVAVLATVATASAQRTRSQVLAFYSTNVEADHVTFAKQALQFYAEKAKRNNYDFESTTNWDDLNAARLKQVKVMLWLNDSPHTQAQRAAFEAYMDHGGGWLGFHVAAYNDADTQWPWFLAFLGGGVFYGNNWPPLPALLNVEDKANPITRHLPSQFISPANEWYSWQPSPRINKSVKVLLTFDQSNFPLGFKDVLAGGDIPVVWTNTRYRMIYMNMGHGDKIFTDTRQNTFFADALKWLVGQKR